MFKKVLIANRGEIAIRVMRSLREMGIRSVAVFSEADRTALHVLQADEAYLLAAPSRESYLHMERILDVAKKCHAEGIHPGYGFLAENAEFAKMCKESKVEFIGPNPEAMQAMGDKTYARRTVEKAGVPIVPGIKQGVQSSEEALAEARKLGFPVLLKAAMGGGGKGVRIVRVPDELPSLFTMATQEAKGAFGDGTLYLEKYLDRPRHIEFQILADEHGNVVHLGERECSIQRRHQKLVEETPSTALDEALRRRMGEAAVNAARAVGYTNAGTIEFMLAQDKSFYFLEMNTRLQVEHPVTEMVTRLDLVKEQVRIAAGEKLSFRQEDIRAEGASLECRINAEDPDNGFLPSIGRITGWTVPGGPGIRLDSGVGAGSEVSVYYDPLVAKLIAWGSDRKEAIHRMLRALSEFHVEGIRTSIPFHQSLLRDEDFVKGEIDTEFLERLESKRERPQSTDEKETRRLAAIAASLAAYLEARTDRKPKTTTPERTSAWKLTAREEGLQR